MYLCLEFGSHVDEISLEGDIVFEVVFSECEAGYWLVIIHIDENEWPDCDWVVDEILDVQLVKNKDLG